MATLLRLNLSIAMCCAVVLCSVLHAQTSSPSPQDIVATIKGGESGRIAPLAQRLGLLSRDGNPCLAYDHPTSHHAVLEQPTRNAVLELRSTDCYYSFIAVLTRLSSGWKHTATLSIPTQFSVPRVSLVHLVRPDETEILIQGWTVDSGSGFFQTNLRVFKSLHGCLRLILDEPESVNFVVPLRDSMNTDQRQRSTFTLEPSQQSPGVQEIIETEAICDHTKKIVRGWEFMWDKRLEVLSKTATYRDPAGSKPCLP